MIEPRRAGTSDCTFPLSTSRHAVRLFLDDVGPMKALPVVALWIVVLVGTAPPDAGAQTIEIGHGHACQTCSITLQLSSRIQAAGSHVPIGNTSVVPRDESGRFLLAHMYERGKLLVFDASGRFVRAVGRRGPGPGEHLTVIALASKADSLFVFDRDLRLCSVPNQSLDMVRSFVMELVPAPASGVTFLPDGRLVVAKHLATRASAGLPLQLFSASGSHVTAFGMRCRDSTRVNRF